VTDCPPTPSATQSLLERIAFIQNTHYGGFWDFTSSSTPTDTAYTNQPLAVHTDTTYLTAPCGLQMFHLLSHSDGTGGQSIFVDGYAAAAHLRDSRPELYAILNRQKIVFHASGNAVVGELNNTSVSGYGSPVISSGLSHTINRFGKAIKSKVVDYKSVPLQIRWNNDDRDAQSWQDFSSLERWYTAAREWTRILKLKRFEIKIQLKPGQPIIFDNWRYLHGRTGFSGERRICGGYSKSSAIE
jgi:trimethyllysine dioxygenase